MNVCDFLTEISDLLDTGALGSRYIICGDLNCPGASGTRGEVNEALAELIDGFRLTQHVHSSTCSTGNLLDHILTSDETININDVSITDIGLSDHSLVT